MTALAEISHRKTHLRHFCCDWGHAFFRQLHYLTISISKPHYFKHLNKSVKSDLQTWLHFLASYNGKTILSPRYTLRFYCDASKVGFGATFGHKWIECLWPTQWSVFNIAFLELFPIYKYGVIFIVLLIYDSKQNTFQL